MGKKGSAVMWVEYSEIATRQCALITENKEYPMGEGSVSKAEKAR